MLWNHDAKLNYPDSTDLSLMMRYNFTSERSTVITKIQWTDIVLKRVTSESSDSSPVALTGYKLWKVQCHVCIMLWICLNCLDIYGILSRYHLNTSGCDRVWAAGLSFTAPSGVRIRILQLCSLSSDCWGHRPNRASNEGSRRLRKVLQLRKRPLLGTSPGWKPLPIVPSHLRHY